MGHVNSHSETEGYINSKRFRNSVLKTYHDTHFLNFTNSSITTFPYPIFFKETLCRDWSLYIFCYLCLITLNPYTQFHLKQMVLCKCNQHNIWSYNFEVMNSEYSKSILFVIWVKSGSVITSWYSWHNSIILEVIQFKKVRPSVVIHGITLKNIFTIINKTYSKWMNTFEHPLMWVCSLKIMYQCSIRTGSTKNKKL
jgi:hypothetical protein